MSNEGFNHQIFPITRRTIQSKDLVQLNQVDTTVKKKKKKKGTEVERQVLQRRNTYTKQKHNYNKLSTRQTFMLDQWHTPKKEGGGGE